MEARRPGAAPSVGEIVGGLAGDVQDLVRGEIALARAELDQKLHRVLMAMASLMGGALIGFAGLVVLLEGIAAALALEIPAWAALLIVGVVIVIVGGVLARTALGALSLDALSPDRAAANLRKDMNVVKEHT